MVDRYIRVYVEGGSVGHVSDHDFRRGWKQFLSQWHELARSHGFHKLEVIRGTGRSATYKKFINHPVNYPNDKCLLLVDSECPVPHGESVWEVVKKRQGDGWERPDWASDDHLCLMVQMVETWILTDHEALRKVFTRLDGSKLPTEHLESCAKDLVDKALQDATSGHYTHGQSHSVLEFTSTARVGTLKHGKRLFERLEKLITGKEPIQHEKWADYLISAIRRLNEEMQILEVRVCKDNVSSIGDFEVWDREKLLSFLENQVSFATIREKSEGEWERGQKVYLSYANGGRYIKAGINDGSLNDSIDLPSF